MITPGFSRALRMCALLTTGFSGLSAQAVDVGVSISVSQPGVYGRIDLGRFPSPVLVQTQPIVVRQVSQRVEPVYLWVPPGHQKNWRKHCHRYQACGVPVFFVKEDWYEQNVRYADSDRDHRGKGHGKGHGKEKGHGKDKHRD